MIGRASGTSRPSGDPVRTKPLLILVLTSLAACGCATSRQQQSFTPRILPGQKGVVISVDGAGGFDALTNSLRKAVDADGLPLAVAQFDWSHGYYRILSDQMDYCHARRQGERLACEVLAMRQQCPAGRIDLVAHSAGCHVVLAATEFLPANTVDRVVLLAPSVSADYDIRPALATSRCGVDVFYSERDVTFLALGMVLFGTADRCWTTDAAGRVGFRAVAVCPQDAVLYSRLRQHRWDPCVAWTGNGGGHYGSYRVNFLRAYVLPLLN